MDVDSIYLHPPRHLRAVLLKNKAGARSVSQQLCAKHWVSAGQVLYRELGKRTQMGLRVTSATQSGCYKAVGKQKQRECWMRKVEATPTLPTSMWGASRCVILDTGKGKRETGAPPLKSGHASMVLWSLHSEALPGTSTLSFLKLTLLPWAGNSDIYLQAGF